MNIQSILAASLLLVLIGCSRLTLENYSKIKVGMQYDEVTALIGQPAKCDDVMGLRNCVWGDETRSINVTFAGDKVLVFSSSNLK